MGAKSIGILCQNQMPEFTLISTGLTSGFGELIPPVIQNKDLFHIFLARTPQNVDTSGLQNTKVIKCDLASIKSVMEACQQIKSLVKSGKVPPVKYFLGNGGIQFPDKVHKTVDGYECTFQTNVISYYILLTKCVMELMESCPGSRVFLTGSGVHSGEYMGMPPPFWPKKVQTIMLPEKDESGDDPTSSIAGRRAYVMSKLCIIYLAHKLADLYPKVEFLVYNPGIVPSTQLGRNAPFFIRLIIAGLRNFPLIYLLSDVSTKSTASKRVVEAMFADKMVDEGNVGYSDTGKLVKSSDLSYNSANKESLWKTLEEIPIDDL